ncbi:glycosyltransferase [Patescibacteria group bacterium]|nr:glycosyltransferase [Patescibacteria group bacterium]MBU2473073.1 glycosyltransferase [Patescibacteria group bacterium]
MKIALIHDYLIRFGGAERVFLNLRDIFPKADIFTLLYDQKKMGQYFPDTKINTSFLQKFPKFWRKRQKYLLPFIPMAPETFDLREYDLVISSSSSFVKGIITRPQAIHICYCHSPMRFGWDAYSSYIKEQRKGPLTNIAIRIMMHYIRIWDRSAANRVDYFIANSKNTAQRIKKFYNQEAKVIYPSALLVESNFQDLNITPNKEYFLIVSQLTPYKRIDLAVDAFNKLELPLIVIGEGPEKKQLQKMAQANIKFLGWQTDEVTRQYFKNCKAFIFPGEDDFGITPVEAMSFGKPVLAYRRGGVTETVLEGITGEFFNDPATESLADGIRRLLMNYDNYSSLLIKKRAEKFSQERFDRSIKEFVIEVVEKNKRI